MLAGNFQEGDFQWYNWGHVIRRYAVCSQEFNGQGKIGIRRDQATWLDSGKIDKPNSFNYRWKFT